MWGLPALYSAAIAGPPSSTSPPASSEIGDIARAARALPSFERGYIT
jgi:hypothetical protein